MNCGVSAIILMIFVKSYVISDRNVLVYQSLHNDNVYAIDADRNVSHLVVDSSVIVRLLQSFDSLVTSVANMFRLIRVCFITRISMLSGVMSDSCVYTIIFVCASEKNRFMT